LSCLLSPFACILSPETAGDRRHSQSIFESRRPTSLSALRPNARQTPTAVLKLQSSQKKGPKKYLEKIL
jgi:hypothetical protein